MLDHLTSQQPKTNLDRSRKDGTRADDSDDDVILLDEEESRPGLTEGRGCRGFWSPYEKIVPLARGDGGRKVLD